MLSKQKVRLQLFFLQIESTKERISTVNSFVLFLRFYRLTVAMNQIKQRIKMHKLMQDYTHTAPYMHKYKEKNRGLLWYKCTLAF